LITGVNFLGEVAKEKSVKPTQPLIRFSLLAQKGGVGASKEVTLLPEGEET